MATTASLLSRAKILLQDTTSIRWPEAELLDWLNDGQREIVLLKPNAYVRNDAVQLVAGSRQSLPAGGIQLIEVVRNMGATGTAAGAAIRYAAREILDTQSPNWHSSTPSGVVKHYMHSPLDPKTYYVYPPQPSPAHYVELVYSTTPADATLVGSITLDGIYQNVLIDYILYRAYSKDAEYAANKERASAHYQMFATALSGKSTVEGATSPSGTGGGVR